MEESFEKLTEEERIFNNIKYFICKFDIDTLEYLQKHVKFDSPEELYNDFRNYFDSFIKDYIFDRLNNYRPNERELVYLLKRKKQENKSIKVITYSIIQEHFLDELFTKFKAFLYTYKHKTHLIRYIQLERLLGIKDYINDVFKLTDSELINVNTRDYCFFDLDGEIFISKYGETHVSIINDLLINKKLNRPELTMETFNEAIKRPTREEISQVEIHFKHVKSVSYGHIVDGCYFIEHNGLTNVESSMSINKVVKDLMLARSNLSVDLKKIYEYFPKKRIVIRIR